MRRTEGGHRASARIVEFAILIALPILLHYLIPVMVVVPRPYSYLGAVVMVLGFALMTCVARLFRQARTGFQLSEGGSRLITTGPFRISRNPMYLGMLIWLIGLAVLLGTLTPFLFPALFFLLANLLIIPLEEKDLEGKAGEEFSEYRRHVRRWF